MSDDEIAKAKEREAQRIAMKAAATFFQKHLPDAQSYLYSRGYNLDDKVITDFQIGYAPLDNKAKSELLAAGFSKQRLRLVYWRKQTKDSSMMFFEIGLCSHIST